MRCEPDDRRVELVAPHFTHRCGVRGIDEERAMASDGDGEGVAQYRDVPGRIGRRQTSELPRLRRVADVQRDHPGVEVGHEGDFVPHDDPAHLTIAVEPSELNRATRVGQIEDENTRATGRYQRSVVAQGSDVSHVAALHLPSPELARLRLVAEIQNRDAEMPVGDENVVPLTLEAPNRAVRIVVTHPSGVLRIADVDQEHPFRAATSCDQTFSNRSETVDGAWEHDVSPLLRGRQVFDRLHHHAH